MLIISDKFKDEEKMVVRQMVELALTKFPEYKPEVLVIDKIEDGSGTLGQAFLSETMKDRIALQFLGLSMHTIGHEIMHHVRYKKLAELPASEPAVDIFTTARDEIFNDKPCVYINDSTTIFNIDKNKWREFCIIGTQYYKELGNYLWISKLKKEMKVWVKKNG
jgi:hypothetical protein